MDKDRFRKIGDWQLLYIGYELEDDPESYNFGRRVGWYCQDRFIWVERYCEQTEEGEYYYPDEVPDDKGKWVARLPDRDRFFEQEAAAWDAAEEYIESHQLPPWQR